MSIELQNAYAVSSATTEYDPDRETKLLFRKAGNFVVESVVPSYCRYTDAILSTPTRYMASRNPMDCCFATRELAETKAFELNRESMQDGDDCHYEVTAPLMEPDYWIASVVSFASEMRNMDATAIRAELDGRRDDLAPLFLDKTPPAVAAAELSKHDPFFDYDAWNSENRPDIPTYEREPEPEGYMPF